MLEKRTVITAVLDNKQPTKHNPEKARQLQCQNTIESNRPLPSSKNSHFSKQG